jgi:hypothetical protein
MRLVADRGVVMNIDEHVEYVRQQFGKEAVDALDALNADTVALARPLAEQLRDFAKGARRIRCLISWDRFSRGPRAVVVSVGSRLQGCR